MTENLLISIQKMAVSHSGYSLKIGHGLEQSLAGCCYALKR